VPNPLVCSDKNGNSEESNVKFKEIGAAYDRILSHLERPEPRMGRGGFGGMPFAFGSGGTFFFGGGGFGGGGGFADYDDDDYYDDEEGDHSDASFDSEQGANPRKF
jgi:molecular chaperone DnaJ